MSEDDSFSGEYQTNDENARTGKNREGKRVTWVCMCVSVWVYGLTGRFTYEVSTGRVREDTVSMIFYLKKKS